jgi:hypothetical protein
MFFLICSLRPSLFDFYFHRLSFFQSIDQRRANNGNKKENFANLSGHILMKHKHKVKGSHTINYSKNTPIILMK